MLLHTYSMIIVFQSNSSLPAYLDKSPEEKVKDLERAMLDMSILFTTKAEDYDVVCLSINRCTICPSHSDVLCQLKLIDCGCEGAVHLVRCSRPELGDTERLYALKTVFNIFGHLSVSKVHKSDHTIRLNVNLCPMVCRSDSNMRMNIRLLQSFLNIPTSSISMRFSSTGLTQLNSSCRLKIRFRLVPFHYL